MSQGNFLKVVDTLEKFQSGLVNTQSPAGKEFVMFKRELYNMYEVQNRSVWEHDSFSFGVERRNLKYLYNANRNFVSEMTRIRQLDQAADHGNLKGKIFQRKFLSTHRLKGLGAFGAATACYMHLTPLTMMLGSTVPMTAIAGCLVYGMRQWNT